MPAAPSWERHLMDTASVLRMATLPLTALLEKRELHGSTTELTPRQLATSGPTDLLRPRRSVPPNLGESAT